jgi:hypothetical protein
MPEVTKQCQYTVFDNHFGHSIFEKGVPQIGSGHMNHPRDSMRTGDRVAVAPDMKAIEGSIADEMNTFASGAKSGGFSRHAIQQQELELEALMQDRESSDPGSLIPILIKKPFAGGCDEEFLDAPFGGSRSNEFGDFLMPF